MILDHTEYTVCSVIVLLQNHSRRTGLYTIVCSHANNISTMLQA